MSLFNSRNYTSAQGGRGYARNPVRDLAALVALEKRKVTEALLDEGSAGREERACVMLVGSLF